MVIRTGLVLSVALWCSLPSAARADDCACAVAACSAIASSQHKSTTSCAQAGKQTAQCTMIATSMLGAMKTLGVAAPAACASLAGAGSGSASGGGGTSGSSSSSSSSSSSGSGSGSSAPSPEPTPLPPDPSTATKSSDGLLACRMNRTGGTRVMVAGGKASFSVTCGGIPSPGNAGGGERQPPTTTNNGTPVQITWSASSGTISGSGSTATWTLPTTTPNPAEQRAQAVVKVGNESVTVYGTVHVVAKHLTLQFRGEALNTCTPLSEGKGTLNVGYDLVCNMSIELTVADDLSVTSSGAGHSCGSGQVSSAQLCMPPMEDSWEAVPGWSFDSASGNIDNVSGIMTMSVTGNRIGLVRVHFKGGKTNDVHTNPLFERSFTMSSDDGSFRSFGSLTTTAHAGGTNAFTIKAH